MPVKRNAQGKWEIQGSERGRRFHRILPEGKSRQDAVRLERKIRDDIFKSVEHGETPDFSIGEAIMRYLKEYDGKARPDGHAVALEPFVKGKVLREMVAVAEAVKRDPSVKNATKNRRLAILKRVAHLAYRRWDWLDEPLHLKIDHLPETGAVQSRAFTRNEVATILRGIRKNSMVKDKDGKWKVANARARLVGRAVLASLYTGLRSGELRSLKPKDFCGDHLTLWDTKNGANRAVPVVPWARWLFKRLPFDVHQATLSHAVSRHVDGRFHWLRHTFGSWLLQSGEPIEIVSKMLGHSSIGLTSKIYSHIPTAIQQETAVRGLTAMRLRKEASRQIPSTTDQRNTKKAANS